MSVIYQYDSEVSHIYKDLLAKNGKCVIFPALYIVGSKIKCNRFYDLTTPRWKLGEPPRVRRVLPLSRCSSLGSFCKATLRGEDSSNILSSIIFLA
jgi:hypothetical protein